MTTITIPSRYNGPPRSGNGGYACGMVAAVVGEGAEVTLRAPPPLDTPLQVASDDGRTIVLDGDTLVAEAEVVTWDLDLPAPPTHDEAAAASVAYRGFQHHEFPTCFTCGTERHDGLGIWPGRVAGTDLVASPFRFGERVRPELVWAALDCPGAWVEARADAGAVVLGRMAARVVAPVPEAADLVAYAWPLGAEGRKSWAGTALARGGEVLAYARQTWISVAKVDELKG